MFLFARGRDRSLIVTLPAGHREVLRLVLTEVRALLEHPDANGRVRNRLFPVAYLDPTEDTAESEWQAGMHDDLVRGKLAAFDDVRALLEHGEPDRAGTTVLVLDHEQEEHLLAALNDLRLVLSELVAGADESGAPDAPGEPEDTASGLAPSDLLEWLSALESELIELKLAEFPAGGFPPDRPPPDGV